MAPAIAVFILPRLPVRRE